MNKEHHNTSESNRSVLYAMQSNCQQMISNTQQRQYASQCSHTQLEPTTTWPCWIFRPYCSCHQHEACRCMPFCPWHMCSGFELLWRRFCCADAMQTNSNGRHWLPAQMPTMTPSSYWRCWKCMQTPFCHRWMHRISLVKPDQGHNPNDVCSWCSSSILNWWCYLGMRNFSTFPSF